MDKRIVKTRRGIEDAFMRLLETRGFEEITVKAIVDEALIAKGTFYFHYVDKYDLARTLVDRTVAEYTEAMNASLAKADSASDFLRLFHQAALPLSHRIRVLSKVRREGIDIREDVRAAFIDGYRRLSIRTGKKADDVVLQGSLLATLLLDLLDRGIAEESDISVSRLVLNLSQLAETLS